MFFVIPLELEVSSLDFLSFPQIKRKPQFSLPLFPEFSSNFCLNFASKHICLMELPQNCHNFAAKNYVPN